MCYSREIICPHCKTKQSSDDIHEDATVYCETEGCELEFFVSVKYDVSYRTATTTGL